MHFNCCLKDILILERICEAPEESLSPEERITPDQYFDVGILILGVGLENWL